MDLEFHYFLTGLIAHKAGFSEDEARIIAYSSQHTDDNVFRYHIRNKQKVIIYKNYVSQTINILKPKKKLWRIYPVFHFVPGKPDNPINYRSDGKMHWLNTTPDNENVNEIIDESFKSSEDLRLYRIGIASHGFADTWAHQNFVGMFDSFNNIGLNPAPDIGHPNFGKNPDYVNHKWQDKRLLNSEVNNNIRFIEAAKKLFLKYSDYNKQKSTDKVWEELKGTIMSLMETKKKKDRINEYHRVIRWLSPYDKDAWFKRSIICRTKFLNKLRFQFLDALIIKFEKCICKDDKDFPNSDWFKFQQAVKAHQKFALNLYNKKLSGKVEFDLSKF